MRIDFPVFADDGIGGIGQFYLYGFLVWIEQDVNVVPSVAHGRPVEMEGNDSCGGREEVQTGTNEVGRTHAKGFVFAA